MSKPIETPKNPWEIPKTRKRKAPLMDAVREARLSRKKVDLIYRTTEKDKDSVVKRITVWFNKKELEDLEALRAIKSYPTQSGAIKKAVQFQLMYNSIERQKAAEIAKEMSMHNIDPRMVADAIKKQEEEK